MLFVYVLIVAYYATNVSGQGRLLEWLIKGRRDSSFPDLFAVDNFDECFMTNENNSYCAAKLNLVHEDKNSHFWKKIESWSTTRSHYNRTEIFRSKCIPEKIKHNHREIKKFILRETANELKQFNLKSELIEMECLQDHVLSVKSLIPVVFLILYLLSVLNATLIDVIVGRPKTPQIIQAFSLKTAFKNLFSNENPDYQRLKCIQGIRVAHATAVAAGHIFWSMVRTNINNPDIVEFVYENPFIQMSVIAFMFLMQTYFVISIWLLTNQILEVHKRKGSFTLADGCLIMSHRVLRFWPPLLAMMFLTYPFSISGPSTFQLNSMFQKSCEKNWWVTLLFSTNFIEHPYDVCNGGMWSLSLDVQYYLFTIIVFYVVLNYNLPIRKNIILLFYLSCLINAFVIYSYDLNGDTWINLKILANLAYFKDENLPYIYTGFSINLSSCMIGMLFGYHYFVEKNNKNRPEVDVDQIVVLSAILPLTAIVLSYFDDRCFIATIVGPFVRPMFAYGMAIAIYGMYNMEYVDTTLLPGQILFYLKSVCEFAPVVWFGHFTCCLYIFHFFVVFGNDYAMTEAHDVNIFDAIFIFIDVMSKSWGLAILATLFIEQPGIALKNLILPPVIPVNEDKSLDKGEKKSD